MHRQEVRSRSTGTQPAGPRSEASPLGAWTRLAVATLSRSLITTVVALALWAALPAAIGWKPTTVSSGSMLPRLEIGDVAVSRPLQSPPTLEQVLLYDDPDHRGRLRMHRFVRVDDQGRIVTKGDANPNEDSTPITPEAILGVGVLRVPYIGLPIVWAREAQWSRVAGTVAVLLLLMAGAGLDRRLRAPDCDEDTSTGSSGTGSDTHAGGSGPTHRQEVERGLTATTTHVRGPTALSHPHAGRIDSPSGPGDLSDGAAAEPRRRRLTGVGHTATAGLVGLGCSALLISTISGPASARYSDTTGSSAEWSAAPYYTCRAAALAVNPYLLYPVNETSSTSVVTDSSGSGRNGSFVGGVTLGGPGACGSADGTAVTLDGTSGYISTPTSLPAPNVFTVQVWFKTTTTRGGKLIGFGAQRTGVSSAYDRHIYMANTGLLYFGVQSGNTRTTIDSGAAYNDGQWHLATATLSSNGMLLYIDSTLVASNTAVTSASAYSGYWRIGYDSVANWTARPTSNYFAGTLDNIATYPTALSADQVRTTFGSR